MVRDPDDRGAREQGALVDRPAHQGRPAARRGEADSPGAGPYAGSGRARLFAAKGTLDGKADYRSGEASGSWGSGDARPPGGHRPRPARREHHGVREAVQRQDGAGAGHGDAGRGHDLQGPDVHLHHQDPARGRAPEEGGRPREGLAHLQPPEGGQGHARPGAPDRRDQDARSQRERHRGGDADGGGHGPLHGPRGGGLMRVHGKRYRGAVAALEPRKLYATREAVEKVKAAAYAKFDESVDVAVRLGVDPKHADQIVRGTVSLPNGTGKKIRVLVIAQGEKAKEGEAAGADFVGVEYVQKIKDGWLDTDVIVATPDA